MKIHPLIEDAAFGPEMVDIMSKAYEAARTRLGATQPDAVLETIAKRIIEGARRGERDSERLLAFALRGLDGAGGQP